MMGKEGTLELPQKLFDITTDQAELLFGRNDEMDLIQKTTLNEYVVTSNDYGVNSNWITRLVPVSSSHLLKESCRKTLHSMW